METMSYPCSPLIPFPTQHKESSYLLCWSPQVVILPQNSNMCDDADPIPSPDDENQDNEFMDMLIFQEASDLLQAAGDLSNGDPFVGFDGSHDGQEENGSLVATVQELELMQEGSSLGDILVACARAVEARDSINFSTIMSRLDTVIIPGSSSYRSYHHHAAGVSSFDRLACYFARGLHSRMSSGAPTVECHTTAAPAAVPENRMPPAYRMMLQELSPFVKFAHFTANQAILEATVDTPNVHVVDLNVGEGVQWASLISDLARRNGSNKTTFHLTAVTAGDKADDLLDNAGGGPCCMTTARRLSEFAESYNLPFRYSSLHLRGEEDLLHGLANYKSCNNSPAVIISCDTTGSSYSSLIKLQMLLLSSVKILQPKLVVLIEDELFRIHRRNPSLGIVTSFVEFFCEALRHFTAVLDSLASGFCDEGYDGMCLGIVEKDMLGPRIEDAVGHYDGAVTTTCGIGGDLLQEGFRACHLSSFNIAQAKMLVGLFSRGFGVVVHEEEGRLALCWNSRPLTSVSVWSPV